MKIAIIGAGYWGKNLIRVFSQLRALDTVCDCDKKALMAMQKKFPLLNYTSVFKDILTNRGITAVAIATSSESHYRLAKEAILAGKDVFVEKPLAMTVEEGAELDKLALQGNKILMVGHLLEYHPAISRLKELIDKGRLGRINYIYSNRLNLGKIRKEENILWSFAPHDISVILKLLGEMPESVSAYGGNCLHKDIADVTVSNFSFRSGIKGHIYVSWLHPYKEQKLVVVGDKKMAVFDDVACDDGKLVIYNYEINNAGKTPVAKRKDAKKIKIDNTEPLLLEARHFLECITKRRRPNTDGRNGIRVLKILQACQSSLENQGAAINLGYPMKKRIMKSNFFVHPTSCVEQPCKIGAGTNIWHYSHVMRGARIGKGCNIGQNVFIGPNTIIGNNVKIQNNISIYEGVELKDDVFCGPSVVFTNVINPRSHICRRHEFKKTVVQKGATLGANATILCGSVIGRYAFVGAGAVVTKSIPDYGLVYGSPARLKGWVCSCAMKLDFNDKYSTCKSCGKSYRYRHGAVTPCPAKR